MSDQKFVRWHGRYGIAEVSVEGDPGDDYTKKLISDGQEAITTAYRAQETTSEIQKEVVALAREHIPGFFARIGGPSTSGPSVIEVNQETHHRLAALHFMELAAAQGWTFTIGEVPGSGTRISASHPEHGEASESDDECLSCAVERLGEDLRAFFKEQMDS